MQAVANVQCNGRASLEQEMFLFACVQRTLGGVRKELRSQDAATDGFGEHSQSEV